MTSQVLPELAKLLGSMDESVVFEAAKLIMELSKKEASCRAIVASEMLVSSLIKAMSTTGNADLQKSLSGTLHNVSNDRYKSVIIFIFCIFPEGYLCVCVTKLQAWPAYDLQLWWDPLSGATFDLSGQCCLVLCYHHFAQHVAAL